MPARRSPRSSSTAARAAPARPPCWAGGRPAPARSPAARVARARRELARARGLWASVASPPMAAAGPAPAASGSASVSSGEPLGDLLGGAMQHLAHQRHDHRGERRGIRRAVDPELGGDHGRRWPTPRWRSPACGVDAALLLPRAAGREDIAADTLASGFRGTPVPRGRVGYGCPMSEGSPARDRRRGGRRGSGGARGGARPARGGRLGHGGRGARPRRRPAAQRGARRRQGRGGRGPVDRPDPGPPGRARRRDGRGHLPHPRRGRERVRVAGPAAALQGNDPAHQPARADRHRARAAQAQPDGEGRSRSIAPGRRPPPPSGTA